MSGKMRCAYTTYFQIFVGGRLAQHSQRGCKIFGLPQGQTGSHVEGDLQSKLSAILRGTVRSPVNNVGLERNSWNHLIFRCKGRCNTNHTACSRGIMSGSMLHCHTVHNALMNSTLNYVSFEAREVETYGKGKPFSRQEKVESMISYPEFQQKLR